MVGRMILIAEMDGSQVNQLMCTMICEVNEPDRRRVSTMSRRSTGASSTGATGAAASSDISSKPATATTARCQLKRLVCRPFIVLLNLSISGVRVPPSTLKYHKSADRQRIFIVIKGLGNRHRVTCRYCPDAKPGGPPFLGRYGTGRASVR